MSTEKSFKHELAVTGAEGSNVKKNLDLATRIAKAHLGEGNDVVVDEERGTLKLRGTVAQVALITESCRDQCELALAHATPLSLQKRFQRFLRAPLEKSVFRHGGNEFPTRSDHDLE